MGERTNVTAFYQAARALQRCKHLCARVKLTQEALSCLCSPVLTDGLISTAKRQSYYQYGVVLVSTDTGCMTPLVPQTWLEMLVRNAAA